MPDLLLRRLLPSAHAEKQNSPQRQSRSQDVPPESEVASSPLPLPADPSTVSALANRPQHFSGPANLPFVAESGPTAGTPVFPGEADMRMNDIEGGDYLGAPAYNWLSKVQKHSANNFLMNDATMTSSWPQQMPPRGSRAARMTRAPNNQQ